MELIRCGGSMSIGFKRVGEMVKASKAPSLNLTDFQRDLHAMSTKQQARRKGANGAFGGCTKDERAVRRLYRRVAK